MLWVRLLTLVVLIADGSLANCKISHRVKPKHVPKTVVTTKIATTTTSIKTMTTATTKEPKIIMSHIPEEENDPPPKMLQVTDDNPVQVIETGEQKRIGGRGADEVTTTTTRPQLTTKRRKLDIHAKIAKKICHQKLEPGYCQSGVRYGFDQRTGRCVQFIYQGCRGNENRFVSIDDCKRGCEDDTNPDEDSDPSEWSSPFWNRLVKKLSKQMNEKKEKKKKKKKKNNKGKKSDERKKKFDDENNRDVLVQAPGMMKPSDDQKSVDTSEPIEKKMTKKRQESEGDVALSINLSPTTTPFEINTHPTSHFSTTQTSEIMEINPPRCRNSIDSGPCHDNEKAFGYDLLLRRCIQFVYGGCDGNSNRFETRDECRRFCEKPGRKVKVNRNSVWRKRVMDRTTPATPKPERLRRSKREMKLKNPKQEQLKTTSQDEKSKELINRFKNRFYERMKDDDDDEDGQTKGDNKEFGNRNRDDFNKRKSELFKEVDAEVDDFLYNNTDSNETIYDVNKLRDETLRQNNERNSSDKKETKKLVENKLIGNDDDSEDDSNNLNGDQSDDDDDDDDDDDEDEDNDESKPNKKKPAADNKSSLFRNMPKKKKKKKKISARCYQKIDPGGCDPGVRFAYDFMSASCVKFTYEGCYGNDNQFLSVEQCSTTCSKPKRKKKEVNI